MIRISILSTGYIEYTIELANSLSNYVDVSLFLPSNISGSDEYSKLISKKVKCHLFHLPRMSNFKAVFALKKVVDKILHSKPHILHLQDSGHPFLFLWTLFLRKIRIVNTIHDPKPHFGDLMTKGRFGVYLGRFFSKHFLVHGPELRDKLIKYYNINKEQISLVPFGGPTSLISNISTKIPSKKKEVLFFGRIWPYKGLKYLIKAEPYIREKISNFKIIIAGKGEDLEKYKKIMKNPNNFEIINYRLGESERISLFERSYIVVLPYIEASQSGITPCSFSLGKPVVATKVGSLSYFIDHGFDGYLVEPRDSKSLSKYIINLLSDDKLYHKMSSNALVKSKTTLSWNYASKCTIKSYNKVLKIKS
mgnify:CR=1 FL=1|tara:strand:- start:62 stop:1153 length:1092 start_codon:yes stop_codon:yes gene_type:complete